MPVTEKYTTLGGSTLDTAYTSGGGTLSPTSAASFPASGVFRVRVDDEIFKVTAVAGGDFTVVGAQEGTSAANHASGAVIFECVTALSWNALRGMGPGPIDRLGFQDYAGLTAINSASGNDDGGRLTLTDGPTSTFDFRLLVKSLTAPVIFTVWFVPTIYRIDYQRVGIVMRESATGKFIWTGLYGSQDRNVSVENWTDPNNRNGGAVYDQSTQYQNTFMTFGVWFQIEYDDTNVICRISRDGKQWVQLSSQAKAVPFTTAPNQLGIGILSGNGNVYPCGMSVLSWFES